MTSRDEDLLGRISALDPEPGPDGELDAAAEELRARIAATPRAGRTRDRVRNRRRTGGALALAALAVSGTALATNGWTVPGFSVFDRGNPAELGDLRNPDVARLLGDPAGLDGAGACEVDQDSVRLARQTPSGFRVFVAQGKARGETVFLVEDPHGIAQLGCNPPTDSQGTRPGVAEPIYYGYESPNGAGYVVGLVPDDARVTLRDGTPVTVESNVFIVEEWATVVVHLPDGTKRAVGATGPLAEARADRAAQEAVEAARRRAADRASEIGPPRG